MPAGLRSVIASLVPPQAAAGTPSRATNRRARQVDQLDVEAAVPRGVSLEPAGDGDALAAGAGAGGDDLPDRLRARIPRLPPVTPPVSRLGNDARPAIAGARRTC